MNKNLNAKEIASFLGNELHGNDCLVTSVSSYSNPKSNTLVFVEKPTAEAWDRISTFEDILVLCPEEFGVGLNCGTIWTNSPRLDFIQIVNKYFTEQADMPFQPGIGKGAVVSPYAAIGSNVSIGSNTVIGSGVSIGDNTVVLNNVSISGRTHIGTNCFIKSGASIGETGFGFCLDSEGVPQAMPHFGGVIIGDNVSLGANSTIERGMFEDTTIADNVKIDDLVQIGHNVVILSGTRIAAGVILCGAVYVEEQCWIAPNSTVRENSRIGNGSFIGLASNVVTNVEPNTLVAGNPAKKIKSLINSAEND